MGALLIGSIIFAGLTVVSYFLISVIFRNDKDNQALGQLCVLMAAACMYIMWATCFLHQLHPIIRPEKSV
ncbi:hypothetical protein NDN08_003851 [Rhodosorus marinus]|uniref:V-type proton ATPase subunit n=1 Tax=Rhodosorus marinus TaxID=101924 RepID=A0AAV8UI20_9RHOD|nr:hypothetical protein NDN08_003851 [Rhodosorus marinus]